MSYVEIKTESVTHSDGSPELWVDGKRIPPLFYALSDIPAARAWNECSQRAIRHFGERGVHIVCADVNLHEGWREDDSYDPAHLLRTLEAVAQANASAKVIARLHLNPPYHWLRRHPDEQIRYLIQEEGKDTPTEPTKTDSGSYGERTIARGLPYEIRAGMASEAWIGDVCRMLRLLAESLKAHPLGRMLIGIQVAYGHCGEWSAYPNGDYSEPMRRLYCRMAKETYGTKERLRRYYGEEADFDTLTLPLPGELTDAFEGDADGVLVPLRHARVIDFLRLYSYASAHAISRFCACIKSAWGKGFLAGAFYTYFFFTTWARSAHFEVEKILTDENVDFLAAPCAYTDNKKSGNMNMLRYVAESCRLHGKLMLCEMDQGYRSVNQTAGTLYVCENEEEYASILKRNVMENILLGCGSWYYDHRVVPSDIHVKEEYWNQKERLDVIESIQRVSESLLEKPYKKMTDVLLVVDAAVKFYTQNGYRRGFDLINAVGKSGAGFDRLFLSDLERVDMDRYRAVILMDCPVLSERTYEYLQNRVLADGREIVILGRFASVVGDRENDPSEMLAACATRCHVTVSQEGIFDSHTYKALFAKAGAHIYTDGDEVVIADNDMVMVHCKDKPRTVLHLPCGDIEVKHERFSTVIYHTQTGKRLL